MEYYLKVTTSFVLLLGLTAQLRTRAKRCLCISFNCGCYQPSRTVHRQLSPISRHQPIYRQQHDATPCVSSCVQNCMQTLQNGCQQSCRNSCSGTQPSYQPPRHPALPSYQYEPLSYEVATTQQSANGACIHICMPSCESQCIQRSTVAPVIPESNTPVPVVQGRNPSYNPFQYEPSVQRNSNQSNNICIHLCMPSCEIQCIEQTTHATQPYPGDRVTEQGNGVNYPQQITYAPPSNQNLVQTYPTSFLGQLQQSGGIATICLPACMPSCQARCTGNKGPSDTAEGYVGTTEEPATPGQPDALPLEISITLPQSIQTSPNCMSLCHESCMQQCVGQSQPADQCRPSCMLSCQDSCAQSAAITPTAGPIQQPESEIYETVSQSPDNAMDPSLFRTFLLGRQQQFDVPEIMNCLSDSKRINDQCNCPSGYAACFSTRSPHNQQQRCCRRRR